MKTGYTAFTIEYIDRNFATMRHLLTRGASKHLPYLWSIAFLVVKIGVQNFHVPHIFYPLFHPFSPSLTSACLCVAGVAKILRTHLSSLHPSTFTTYTRHRAESRDNERGGKLTKVTMFHPRPSGCTFFYFLVIFFLPLHYCFHPINSLQSIPQGFVLSAKFQNDFDEDDEDDYIPEVDVKNFKPPSTAASFGFNSGRSSPSIRKAMGISGKSSAKGKVWCVWRSSSCKRIRLTHYWSTRSLCLHKLWDRVGAMERKMSYMSWVEHVSGVFSRQGK